MEDIIKTDHYLTKRLAICANPLTPHQKLRFVFRVLEVSFHGVPWLLYVFAAILWSEDMHQATFNVNLLVALLLDLCVALVLKLAVRRPRPAHHHSQDFLMTVKIDNQFSFPSGHTTRAIMCGCLLLYYLELTSIGQFLVCLWSLSTSISRVMLGRHYVTDILGGSLVGFIMFFVLIQYMTVDEKTCWNISRYSRNLLSGPDIDELSSL